MGRLLTALLLLVMCLIAGTTGNLGTSHTVQPSQVAWETAQLNDDAGIGRVRGGHGPDPSKAMNGVGRDVFDVPGHQFPAEGEPDAVDTTQPDLAFAHVTSTGHHSRAIDVLVTRTWYPPERPPRSI